MQKAIFGCLWSTHLFLFLFCVYVCVCAGVAAFWGMNHMMLLEAIEARKYVCAHYSKTASQPMSFARHRLLFMDVSTNGSCTISAIWCPCVSQRFKPRSGLFYPIQSTKSLYMFFFRTSRINYCNVLASGLTTSGQAMFDIIRSVPVSLPIPDQTRFPLWLLVRAS